MNTSVDIQCEVSLKCRAANDPSVFHNHREGSYFSWLKAATTAFTLKTLLRHRDTESVKDIYSNFKDFFNEPSPANGCNKMNCECGVTMCYLCRMIVPNNYDHFIGPGGSEEDGICPLYSDMNTLHRDEINNAALEAKNELEITMLH